MRKKKTEIAKSSSQVTIREVAKTAGSSITTASHVLNSRRVVPEKTRRAIPDALEKAEDRANPSAGSRGMNETRAAMGKMIASYVAERGIGQTDVPHLNVAHITGPRPSTTYLYEPSLCVCVRGSKRVLLGDEFYVYDETHFLLTTIGLPTIIQINDADPGIPYTALQIILDLDLARQMMIEIDANGIDQIRSDAGIVVGDLSPDLLDAVARLVELLAKPHDIPIMNGLIHREILYRILVSKMGKRLRQIVRIGSQANRVVQAVSWLRAHYTERLRIDDLAQHTGMAVSTLHRHFQDVTTLSPLQYQKQLRLHEARRLMLSEEKDAGTAALQVGYESVTQFTREYRRLFGAPPKRDVTGLRNKSGFHSDVGA